MSEATPLGRALTTIRDLRNELECLRHPAPVAVIGVGMRYPQGASTLDALASQLQRGEPRSLPFPDSRRRHDAEVWEGLGGAPGSYLDDIWSFDRAYFGISEEEARALDPRVRLLLELAVEALEDAGLQAADAAGTRTGLFLVTTGRDHLRWAPELTADWARGSGDCFALGRLSFHLGIEGPASCVDSACSSAVVALDEARRALQRGECDLALVGGAQLVLDPEDYATGQAAGMLSSDGVCRSFGAGSDGFVRGEGAGMLVLRRALDADERCERVHALVHASGIRQTGRATGFAVPNVLAESEGIAAVCAESEVDLGQIGLVEAHGTASEIGDAVEIEALAHAFSGRGRADRLLVTCSKPVLGHTESLAGLTGVLAAMVALRTGAASPVAGLGERNAMVEWDGLPLELVDGNRPLPKTRPLVLVSALGMGGANGFVVLGPPASPQESTVQTVPAHCWNREDCSPQELLGIPQARRAQLVDDPAEEVHVPDQLVGVRWAVNERSKDSSTGDGGLGEVVLVAGEPELTRRVREELQQAGAHVRELPADQADRIPADGLVVDLSTTLAGTGAVTAARLRTVVDAGAHPEAPLHDIAGVQRWWQIALAGAGAVLDVAGSTDAAADVVSWLQGSVPASACVLGGDRTVALSADPLPAAGALRHAGDSYRITATSPGRLESVGPVAAEPLACAPGEVRIRVAASGLNFSDVLKALGHYPGHVGEPVLGVECSGVVEALGTGVDDLQIGDQVMAIGAGTFAQTLVTPRHLVAPIPAGTDLNEAAGIPVAFLTAALAVLVEGQIGAGETVLVHSAAGGVGQAAVQIALGAGATVLATASTSEKHELLYSLGVSEVGNSRSEAFVPVVQAATHGRGVDVVVNSLAGELLQASTRLLAPGGRFVELGKRDVYGGSSLPMSIFREGRSFSAVDLDAVVWRRPALVRQLWKLIAEGFADGRFHPTTTTQVKAADLAEVMAEMAEGHHVGKLVVVDLAETPSNTQRGEGAPVRDTRAVLHGWPAQPLQEAADILLRGGWTRFSLVPDGDRVHALAAAASLRLAGAEVSLDDRVTSAERLVLVAPSEATKTSAAAWQQLGEGLAFSGCRRATVVVDDTTSLPAALAWVRTQHRPGLTIDLWQRCAFGAMPVDLEDATDLLVAFDRSAASHLVRTDTVGSPPPQGRTHAVDRVMGAMPGASRVRVMSEVAAQVAGDLLGLSAVQVDLHDPLSELGFTSLKSLQFRQRLEDELGLRLPATLGWQYPTLAALAQHLVELVEQHDVPMPAEPTVDQPVPDSPAADAAAPMDLDALNRKMTELEKELS